MPKISVIIPLFNKERYIERALLSVLNQRFQDYEIIVVDDGSTDLSVMNVKKLQDTRIRLIQQKNYGVSCARNEGVMHSNSEIITFLDADDEYTPSYLSIIWSLVRKYPEAGAFAVDFDRIILPKHNKNTNPIKRDCIISNYFEKVLKKGFRISSSSIAVRKEAFCTLKGFKKGASWGEDQDFWARLAINYPIAFTSLKCVVTHHTNNPLKQIGQRHSITREHPFLESSQLLINDGKISENIINNFNEYRAKLKIMSASLNLICGDQKKAQTILKKCNTRRFLLNKLWCVVWTKLPEKILNKFKGTFFIIGEMGIECIQNQRNFNETIQVFLKYWIYRISITET